MSTLLAKCVTRFLMRSARTSSPPSPSMLMTSSAPAPAPGSVSPPPGRSARMRCSRFPRNSARGPVPSVQGQCQVSSATHSVQGQCREPVPGSRVPGIREPRSREPAPMSREPVSIEPVSGEPVSREPVSTVPVSALTVTRVPAPVSVLRASAKSVQCQEGPVPGVSSADGDQSARASLSVESQCQESPVPRSSSCQECPVPECSVLRVLRS